MVGRVLRVLGRIALAGTVALGVVAVMPAAAQASSQVQHRDANAYAYWDYNAPGGYYNHDSEMIVRRKAPSSYWAMNWGFTGGGEGGGYMGLQTNGNRFDGSQGDTAIVSLWDANAVRNGKCGSFGGEGSGLSCRVPMTIETGTAYRLRVWRLDADAGGQWWGAWVLNERTGREVHLGELRVEGAKRWMGPAMHFSEYYGPARACNAVPQSVVDFTQPAADFDGRYYRAYSHFASSHIGACTGGSVRVVDWGSTRAARVTLGG